MNMMKVNMFSPIKDKRIPQKNDKKKGELNWFSHAKGKEIPQQKARKICERQLNGKYDSSRKRK